MKALGNHTHKAVQFNLNAELSLHAWHPRMTSLDAEKALSGKTPYTYLIRKNTRNVRKYDISFVQQNGLVKHDTFTFINPKYGIWRNGQGSHLGKLAKVVRDMMDCAMDVGQPL